MELFRSLAHQEFAQAESYRARLFQKVAGFVNQYGEQGLRRHLVDFTDGGEKSREEVEASVMAFIATTRRVNQEGSAHRYQEEIEYSLSEEFYDRHFGSARVEIETRGRRSEACLRFYFFSFYITDNDLFSPRMPCPLAGLLPESVRQVGRFR